jgi:ubiquinone/menaquinone biosynthesis C-methylase UbiE
VDQDGTGKFGRSKEKIRRVTLPNVNSAERRQEFTESRKTYWQGFAGELEQWASRRKVYQSRLREIYSFMIPPAQRVLEVGCGQGDLLAAVRPARGVGVDLSERMVERAKERHPQFEFAVADAHDFDLGETFDYIICSDLLNDLWDVAEVLRLIRRHCHAQTRLILNFFNPLWEQPRRLAEAIGLTRRQLVQNWLSEDDVRNLLYLSELETLRMFREVLWPVPGGPMRSLANRYLVKLWPFQRWGVANFVVARPFAAPGESPDPVVSVVVPARNEAGNIGGILDRVPEMGAGTEVVFVEGNSTDNTWETIEEEIARRPGRPIRAYKQTGKGKGDAVRLGFGHATGDLLMILDADMTVAPEDLPRFYAAWRSGKADFVNGVRLVYPMHEEAMRLFNHWGNRFFAGAFSWLLSQSIKDTLCGTKVLSRQHYQMIAANRAYFGDFDPFGDFDLIFGAARFNLKIVDVPIRYWERVYGDTNINRWRDGAILLRMVLYSLRRIKMV